MQLRGPPFYNTRPNRGQAESQVVLGPLKKIAGIFFGKLRDLSAEWRSLGRRGPHLLGGVYGLGRMPPRILPSPSFFFIFFIFFYFFFIFFFFFFFFFLQLIVIPFFIYILFSNIRYWNCLYFNSNDIKYS